MKKNNIIDIPIILIKMKTNNNINLFFIIIKY